MLNFEYLGKPLTAQKITPGNTATAFNKEMYEYTERVIAFTSGGATEVLPGDWIVGATSGAVAQIVSVTVTSGTWAGTDAAGTFRIRSQNGTFQSENLNVAGNSNVATVGGNSSIYNGGYPDKNRTAKACIIAIRDNEVLACVDGSTPDQTALIGMPVDAGESWVLRGIDEIRNFKVIDYASGSAGVVFAIFYF